MNINIEKIKILDLTKLQVIFTHKDKADLKTQLSVDIQSLHADFDNALIKLNKFCLNQCEDILSTTATIQSAVFIQEITLKGRFGFIKFKLNAPDLSNPNKFKNYILETPPFETDCSLSVAITNMLDEIHDIVNGKRAQLDIINDTELNPDYQEAEVLMITEVKKIEHQTNVLEASSEKAEPALI